MRALHEAILLAALVACGRGAQEPSPALETPPALGAPYAIGPDRPSTTFGPWWKLDTIRPRHPDSAMVVVPPPHPDSVMVVVPPPHPDTVMVWRPFGASPPSGPGK